MTAQVFAVASGKGGVGKTTTAVNLAVALRAAGHAVAVVDADLGMPNLTGFLSIDPDVTVHDVLAGSAPAEAAVTEVAEGFAVVGGDPALEGFAAADPEGLEDVIAALAADHEYVLVDTGAGVSYESVLPLGLVDAVILVTSADPAAVGDTRKSRELADRLDVPVRGVVITKTDDVDSDAIASQLETTVLAVVPESRAVRESTASGDPLAAHAPEDPATAAYESLADAIAAEVDPTLEGTVAGATSGVGQRAGEASTDDTETATGRETETEPEADEPTSAGEDGDAVGDVESDAATASIDTVEEETATDAPAEPAPTVAAASDGADDPDDPDGSDGSDDSKARGWFFSRIAGAFR